MRHSVKVGLSFGVTSGIITTLGLMVGLHSGTNSRLAVIGGILIIAVADALSDALGIHISEEFENKHTGKQIWASTIATFFAKFAFALTFVIPVLLLELPIAILVSITWGFLMLSVISYGVSKEQKVSPWKVIGEHLFIASIVIITTHYLGDWIALKFS